MANEIEILKLNGQKVGDFRDPTKALKGTTLGEYNIQNAYTKTQVDAKVGAVSSAVVKMKEDSEDILKTLRTDINKNTVKTTRNAALIAEAENDIANLQSLYQALTQTDVQVVKSADWPLSTLQERVIYRVQGTTSYTDYMYNGVEPIPMATYNNAIDDEPTNDSENLAKSGGIARVYGSYEEHPKYVKVEVDAESHIIFGVSTDGSIVIMPDKDGKSNLPEKVKIAKSIELNGITTELIDNPKFIRALLDSQNHILFGIKNDGDVVFGKIPSQIKKHTNTYIVSKSGKGDYSSLTKAIMDNMGIWGITLYINDGQYDLLSELAEYYGTTNFLQQTPRGRGIELGYDIKLIGSPNAIIKANYTGNDENMQKLFSPFNCYSRANTGGFTMIGLNIQCSKVRYCVHDEKGASGAGTYNNIYDNCSFYIDNTNNAYWHSSQCIGGGLGHSGNIIIRNCIFEQIEPSNPNNSCVSYHNNRRAGAKSFISCTNNYIKGNRGFRFSWYGDSEEITEVICSGNNVGRATEFRAETAPDSPDGPSLIQNIALYEWNNVIR